jgi:hypothetical protein
MSMNQGGITMEKKATKAKPKTKKTMTKCCKACTCGKKMTKKAK